MRYQTRQRLHLELAKLPVLPAHPKQPPVAFPRTRTGRDNAEHTRELRHARRAVRQQLHDLERTDLEATAEWELEA